MSEHPIQSLMQTALDHLKGVVDAGSVIGEPIQTPDGTVVIPICRTSLGFVTGGTEYASSKAPKSPFGGGIGGGVSVTPFAFLILSASGVQTVTLESSNDLIGRLLDLSPQLLDKLNRLLNR